MTSAASKNFKDYDLLQTASGDLGGLGSERGDGLYGKDSYIDQLTAAQYAQNAQSNSIGNNQNNRYYQQRLESLYQNYPALSRRQGYLDTSYQNSRYGLTGLGNNDLLGAYSNYGIQPQAGGGCNRILSGNMILFILTLGAGIAWYFIYNEVINGGDRKRNNDAGAAKGKGWFDDFDINKTLEEFEDTISKIGDDASGNDSWISKMFKNFVGPSLGLNDVESFNMDGLEPPVLDETWGLGDSKYFAPHKDDDADSPKTDEKTADEKTNERTKRFADEDADFEAKLSANEADDYVNSLVGEEKCKIKFWRCMTGVLQGGMHYLSEPEGITGAAKKAMFKMAFSGQLGGFWNALMTIPEARRIKRCMNANDECMTYETIKAEADITLDSNPRLIVNPDFVENKDTSDGAMEFDEETAKKLADEGYGNFF